MSAKLLTEHHLECLSLKGGCIGSSESTLIKMPHCWKSRVMAHYDDCMLYFQTRFPCRIRSMNYFNTGAIFETGFTMISPFLSEKVRNRVSYGRLNGVPLKSIISKLLATKSVISIIYRQKWAIRTIVQCSLH